VDDFPGGPGYRNYRLALIIATNLDTAHPCVNSAAYDHALMKQFMALFPTSPIALLLAGYFSYIGAPMLNEEDKPLIFLEDTSFDTIIVGMILDNLSSVYLISFPERFLRYSQLHHDN